MLDRPVGALYGWEVAVTQQRQPQVSMWAREHHHLDPAEVYPPLGMV